MRHGLGVLLAALSLAGAGIAVPAFAAQTGPVNPAGIGLPSLPPVLPTRVPPGVPLPSLPPLPTSLPSLPALPTLPPLPALPTTVPGVPLPTTLPQLPTFPGVPPQGSGPGTTAQGGLGYLAFGHYLDDGLGSAGVPPLAPPKPQDALPAALPYDSTGYDKTDYGLPRNWVSSADRAAAASQADNGHGSLPWVLLAAVLGLAAIGTVVVRKRTS